MNVTLTARVELATKRELQRIAAKHGKTLSGLVQQVLDEMIVQEQARERALATAIEEADMGAFISRDKMRVWRESLGTDCPLPRPQPDVFLS